MIMAERRQRKRIQEQSGMKRKERSGMEPEEQSGMEPEEQSGMKRKEQSGMERKEQSGMERKEQSGMESEAAERKETYSIEETFARIDGLIGRLESPEIGLEQSFQAYEEGMKLLKACNDQIDRVEKKVLALSGDGGFDELGE